MVRKQDKTEFARGTQVGVRFTGRIRAATVTEDRGIIAGHRLVRVRLGTLDDSEALEFEVPADELEPLPTAA